MFREQLHKDIDRITPSPELLDKISLMMREQVQKPKPRIFMNAVRYGGMAAAICLVSAAVIIFGIDGGISTSSPSQSPLSGGRSAETPQAAAGTAALQPAAFGAYEATTTAVAAVPYAETGAEIPLVSGTAYSLTEAKVSTSGSEPGDLYSITPPCPVYPSSDTGSAAASYNMFSVNQADMPYYTMEDIAEKVKDGSLSMLNLTITRRMNENEYSEIEGISEIAENSAIPVSCYKITITEGWGGIFDSDTDASIPATAVFFGDESQQILADPCYAEGDSILCTAEISSEGIIIIREYFLCDIYDSALDEAAGETTACAYLRIAPKEEMLDTFPNSLVYYSVATTTNSNYAVYHQAFSLEALTEYLDSIL
ncbi:MAG: hypothetical protein ACI4KR_09495 [Ruminiclostridium sp.]